MSPHSNTNKRAANLGKPLCFFSGFVRNVRFSFVLRRATGAKERASAGRKRRVRNRAGDEPLGATRQRRFDSPNSVCGLRQRQGRGSGFGAGVPGRFCTRSTMGSDTRFNYWLSRAWNAGKTGTWPMADRAVARGRRKSSRSGPLHADAADAGVPLRIDRGGLRGLSRDNARPARALPGDRTRRPLRCRVQGRRERIFGTLLLVCCDGKLLQETRCARNHLDAAEGRHDDSRRAREARQASRIFAGVRASGRPLAPIQAGLPWEPFSRRCVAPSAGCSWKRRLRTP